MNINYNVSRNVYSHKTPSVEIKQKSPTKLVDFESKIKCFENTHFLGKFFTNIHFSVNLEHETHAVHCTVQSRRHQNINIGLNMCKEIFAYVQARSVAVRQACAL